ncbi:MAG: helix-turn-helix transcriptional regulator [Lachnospiraceae bacterium]|nr:helix-turn-helix transcriptional regulator [Lachnospiraceae bacterium]
MKSHLLLKNRIREFRQAKGMTQTDLAKAADTTQNTISSIETGQYSPTAYLSGLICIALGCKWEECFYYVEEEDGKKSKKGK